MARSRANALNWDNLRVFLAVARSHSAMEVASQLGMDHSTITRRLHRLEKEMRCQLFERNTQGHQLTQSGHRLLEYVERIESTLATVETELGGENQVLTGNVRLGATEGFGTYFLAPHLAEFCVRHPALTVDLLALPRLVNLSKHEADLAVNIERPQSGAYVVSKLSDFRMQLYATREYLLNQPTITTLSDLHRHTFISYVDEMIFSEDLRYLNSFASGATVSLRSNSIVAQLTAVRKGHGISFLPCFMANTYPELIPVLPHTADVLRTFWLIVPKERREIARVKALSEFLRATAKANYDFLIGKSDSMSFT